MGKEMFGLVADGLKNENGEVPYPSTYICMINGTFKEWICIFNDLEVSICQIYIFWLKQKIWECYTNIFQFN